MMFPSILQQIENKCIFVVSYNLRGTSLKST